MYTHTHTHVYMCVCLCVCVCVRVRVCLCACVCFTRTPSARTQRHACPYLLLTVQVFPAGDHEQSRGPLEAEAEKTPEGKQDNPKGTL